MFVRSIERIALPQWPAGATLGGLFLAIIIITALTSPPDLPNYNVAFVGNSMMYYNDLPRFMEALADGHLTQNSCLHGNSNLESIITMGNGMYDIWSTGNARMKNSHGSLHDFGACTVAQLLFGFDENLDKRMQELYKNQKAAYYDDDAVGDHDGTDDGDVEKMYGDDYFQYDDGKNPCLRSPFYYAYLSKVYEHEGIPKFDFIILNDNTRSPARKDTREQSLEILEGTYVQWFLETKATPIFISTYAYWTPYRDMGGLDTIPEFTSLTYEGYKEYAELLEQFLPKSQKPRIAPVGAAFLIVWEENRNLWQRMFHVDLIHASPIGSYLQGLILYHTIFGRLPRAETAIRGDMFTLWMEARKFQPGEHRRTPFPTQEEAAYLYDVAARLMDHGHSPRTMIYYKYKNATDYIPDDSLYKVDDLF